MIILPKNREELNESRNNGNAALCVQCGECLEKCPQEINIPYELEKVHLVLGEGQDFSKVFKLFIRGPKIVEKEAFQIVGIEDVNKREKRNVPQMWAKFYEIIHKVQNRDGSHGLGISLSTKELLEKGEDRFIVAHEILKVENIPEELIVEKFPAQKYAVFTHLGKLDNLGETFDYIYGDWLPNNSRYERVPFAPEFEWYDQRFQKNSDTSGLDLYIPIREKTNL